MKEDSKNYCLNDYMPQCSSVNAAATSFNLFRWLSFLKNLKPTLDISKGGGRVYIDIFWFEFYNCSHPTGLNMFERSLIELLNYKSSQ